jgi:hypothetical protein
MSQRPDSQAEAHETPATLGASWTPATAVITREIGPGREHDYQEWSQPGR